MQLLSQIIAVLFISSLSLSLSLSLSQSAINNNSEEANEVSSFSHTTLHFQLEIPTVAKCTLVVAD